MAATTISTMAMLNAKCILSASSSSSSPKPNLITLPSRPTKSVLQSLPKSLTGTAIAGAVFSTLSSCDPALAAQQLAVLADGAAAGDNRGLALLLPIVPAIAWVLYNILQPTLNQINKMSAKGVIVGLGLGGGLAASGGFLSTPHAVAAADQVATLAEEAAKAGDSRGQLLLIVVAPAILWVLYNILQPALNQINKMRS
ncbi:hypothetical protein DCAR_0936173 [Daucus carota subsp. sativus]|uniref:Uncharacterized protein n=1 Tax=Daucus carota subsp. sativus TaxID=79200 RepID=A0AAF0XZ61_DAUCS|nr:PREDICTED: photosystem II core complex proteins psbY, chloroplastic [Daucus carota subsp. sativus]WOH16615.1 hypothetical protein DCAR_0936173 [Daucus carota subsp. sativus]